MELYQLRAFVAVAQCGNLSRAARTLCASQPAVSAQIKALEDELGLALFVRTARGMSLTPAGGDLLDQARLTLDAARSVLVQARNLAGEVSGHLRLGRNTDPEFLRLGQALGRIAACAPRVQVHIDCCDSYDVPQALLEERLDAGFAYGESFGPGLTAEVLGTATLRVVGPPAWRARLEDASLEDLARMPWVWFHERCPFGAIAARLLGVGDKGLTTTAYINDENTLRTLVATGHGLSLLRWDEAERARCGYGLAVWPGAELEIPVNIVALARRWNEPGVRLLVEAARDVWEDVA